MKPLAITGETWVLYDRDLNRGLTVPPTRDILTAIVERFEFLQGPPGLIPQPGEGYVFREGALRGEGAPVKISRLNVYQDGATAAVEGGTDASDFVVAELGRLFVEKGVRISDVPIVQYNGSTIVVEFGADIDRLIGGFVKLQRLIESKVNLRAPIKLTGLAFNADPAHLSGRLAQVNPTYFRLERRKEVEYSELRYFSMANATTANHLAILEEIEEMAA